MTLVPRSSQGFLKLGRGSRGRPLLKMPRFVTLVRSRSTARTPRSTRSSRGSTANGPGRAPRREAGGAARRMDQPHGRRVQDSTRRQSRDHGRSSSWTRWPRTQAPDSIYWAKELLNVEPKDPDAHYVLAAEALEERTPNVPEIKRHLDVLDEVAASPVRRLWIRARLADLIGDAAAREAAFVEARAATPEADPNSVDRFARLRLLSLEIRSEGRWTELPGQVEKLREQVKGLGKPEEMPPGRVARLGLLLEQTQRSLTSRSTKLPADRRKAVEGLVDTIEVDLNSVFQQALAEGRQPDLQTYLSYADHLRFRRQTDRCLEVIDRALLAAQGQGRRVATQTVMNLHTVAAEMILARLDDAERFEKAAPHIQALLDCPESRSQAVGHLFAGVIELDRSTDGPRSRRKPRPAAPAGKAQDDEAQQCRCLGPPQGRRHGVTRSRRGAGVPRRRAGPGTGAEPRPPVPPDRDPTRPAWSPSTSSGPPGRSSRPAIPRRPNRSSDRLLHQVDLGNLPREMEGPSTCSRGEALPGSDGARMT